MSEKLEVHGAVAPGFERVREEFAAVLAEESHNEPGSQLAAYLGGRLVVDLAAGDNFPAEKLTGLYSVTKGAAHLVFALLVQDGVIDLDRPVADYWPDFTGAGKEDARSARSACPRRGPDRRRPPDDDARDRR